MNCRVLFYPTIAFALCAGLHSVRAGEDKVHEVGKSGLTLEGKIAADDLKIKLILGDKSQSLPAKLFQVRLIAGKRYRVSLDSKEIDSVLVLQDAAGRLMAWDDDSGGDLNSLLNLNILQSSVYKVFAASLKGSGNFILRVQEEAIVKGPVHDVGTGLEIKGELGKSNPMTYQVKLAAGKTYVFDMISQKPAAFDPCLHLLDPKGNQLAMDDFAGGGLNSRIIHNIERTGTYQIVAMCVGNGRGPFTLRVRDARDGERAWTGDEQEKLSRARQMGSKAVALHQAGKTAEALKSFQQALTLHKEVLGEKHPVYAVSLNNLAYFYRTQQDYAKAEPLYRDALEINKELLGRKHPNYAKSLINLAFLYNAQVKYAKAEPLYREALEITKEVLGQKHPDYATSLYGLIMLYDAQANYPKAEPLYREAVEIQKELLGEKDPNYAATLSGLGSLYKLQGEYSNAEPLLRQALEIRRQVQGEKHADYAASLNNMASLYEAQGNHAKAEPLYRQALEINREVFGEKHPIYAKSLNNIGLFYSQSNYAKAESMYRQALEIRKQTLGEKHSDYGTLLNNMALLYYWQGNYAKAEPLHRQALEIKKQALGEKHPEYAISLNNLAALYSIQGNYSKAEAHYIQALEIRKEVLGDTHPDYATTLGNLAALYDLQGNHANAILMSRQAILATMMTKARIAIEDAQPDDLRIHPRTVLILENHAALLQKAAGKSSSSKDHRACDRAYFLALTILDRVREDYREAQESKTSLIAERFYLIARRLRRLHQLFDLEQKPEDLEAAFWTAEQGIARTFLDTLGKSRANRLAGVSSSLESEEIQLLQEIRLLDLRIDNESARTLDVRNPDLIGEFLAQRKDAESNLLKLIARIETQHPKYAGLKYPRPCKLEEARECLAADEVALLFVPGTDESFIVLVESRAKPGDNANGLAIIELPGAATLAEYVATLTDTGTLGLPARTRLLGRQAFDVLLGRCKDRILGKNLVIVPNGTLCFLPFELLVEDDGKYLVEKHRIRYAPSLTALHHISLWKQKRAAPQTPLFAVGDPLYDAGAPPPSDSRFNTVVASRGSDELLDLLWRERRADPFKRLIHSGKEITEIAKLLGAKSDYILTGADASEGKVKAASIGDKMSKARYIHFATHGILGVDKGKQPALVLNLVGNSGKDGEDGFLEYEEILSLKLNADLVVLSACRTGQGSMARGEGVTGLARAFLYAGSKGVVCSLWSVDDRETANLMVDFYGHLQNGRPAAEALREAQLRMIREGKAPLYWAPFILIGE